MGSELAYQVGLVNSRVTGSCCPGAELDMLSS